MLNKNYLITVFTCVLLAVVLTFQITFVSMEIKHQKELDSFLSEFGDTFNTYGKIAEVDSLYRSLYIGELDDEALLDGVIAGYVFGTGDTYGGYYSKTEFDEFLSDTAGESMGIGVYIKESDGLIEVVNVMPNSPAIENGVKPGDVIIRVDGEEVPKLGYENAIERMRGEEGSKAEFTVRRDGIEIDFSVIRRKFEQLSVTSRLFEHDSTVGIVRIDSFDKKTPEQFKTACESLIKDGAKSIVFDVRDNGGGELDSICSVLDYLVGEGPIVRLGNAEGINETRTSDANELKIPMCVLVNGNTASAAELFASALQDYKKATLVGTTTFGKGTVQQLVTLSDGTGIKMTTGMYYPPFSDGYDGIGVIPDVECEMDAELEGMDFYEMTDSEDTQLCKAVEILGGKTVATESDDIAEEDAANDGIVADDKAA